MKNDSPRSEKDVMPPEWAFVEELVAETLQTGRNYIGDLGAVKKSSLLRFVRRIIWWVKIASSRLDVPKEEVTGTFAPSKECQSELFDHGPWNN